MRHRLKRKVIIIIRVTILTIILAGYLIFKVIMLDGYQHQFNRVEDMYLKGKVLDKINLEPYRSSQSIFIDKEYKIGIEYNNIEKRGEDGYLITNLDNVEYTIRFSIKDGDDRYKEYYEMINNINRLMKDKDGVLTPTILIKRHEKLLKDINTNIPKYNEIAILDGHDFNGYIYKVDNVYNSILYGDNKVIEISFVGDNLRYDYISNVLSTIEKD